MRIAIGCDHAAFRAKEALARELQRLGHEVVDAGAMSEESCDYPDFAWRVARDVASGSCERGVLMCGTGIGMSMAANKVAGVRAAACQDERAAEMSRRHNDANVLCMGARLLDEESLLRIARLWLATPFEAGRHSRRVDKIARIEKGQDPNGQ